MMEMNNNLATQLKIAIALDKFRKEIDEIYPGVTPKIEGEMNDVYDCDIYIFRHPGMGNSKQIITGNPISIYTATASYLETLMRQGIFEEAMVRDMVEMAIKASKGEIK